MTRDYRWRALVLVQGLLIGWLGTAWSVETPDADQTARHYLVVAANPLASQAGAEMLERGGSATDAAIAVQMVLTLVEPQSSGIGGGAYALYWQADKGQLSAWDGRETAPAAAGPDLFLDASGKPMDWWQALAGGRSVGVPGVLDMLWRMHQRHGKLPWADLFQPAIKLARDGFEVSPRLHQKVAERRNPALGRYDTAWRYFFPGGEPLTVGHKLQNPQLADTLARIAQLGPRAFYQGDIAINLVRTVQAAEDNPGQLSLADLAVYRALEREPLCLTYRSYRVCGMPPSSSGGLTVLQILGILSHFDLPSLPPSSAEAAHLFTQAARLAYADRDRYIGDPDFVQVPVNALLDSGYLASRAALIDPQFDMGQASAGELPAGPPTRPGQSPEQPGTSHLSIVDDEGNAISMTSSIEMAFGSTLMVRGFLLNNQLTDFSFLPGDVNQRVANRVQGGKRPRSSMSPTMVFDRDGRLLYVLGSPGGSRIINYVAQTLVALLDHHLPLREALAQPHVVNRNGVTELEQGRGLDALGAQLAAFGHEVKQVELDSGLHAIGLETVGYLGAADPRREGRAIGR